MYYLKFVFCFLKLLCSKWFELRNNIWLCVPIMLVRVDPRWAIVGSGDWCLNNLRVIDDEFCWGYQNFTCQCLQQFFSGPLSLRPLDSIMKCKLLCIILLWNIFVIDQSFWSIFIIMPWKLTVMVDLRLIGGSDFKIIYRHYATLYFVFCVDSSESELGILDLIQVSWNMKSTQLQHWTFWSKPIYCHS